MKKQTLEEAANKANGYNVYAKETKAPIFNEGFIAGAKWQQEQAKETQKLTMINALVEFSKAHFDIHTEEAILNITRRAEQYYNETFKQNK